MFKCDSCNREFENFRQLNGHKRVHGLSNGTYSVNRKKQDNSISFTCLNCNKESNYNPSHSQGKFCSSKCCGEYRYKNDSLPRLLEGKASPTILKKYIVSTQGYKCSVCHISTWNGKELSLHLDHIDGNSDNNLPENGRLLCPNCHSQTETFCGKNKKNTKRNQYLQRYKSDKTQKRINDIPF